MHSAIACTTSCTKLARRRLEGDALAIGRRGIAGLQMKYALRCRRGRDSVYNHTRSCSCARVDLVTLGTTRN